MRPAAQKSLSLTAGALLAMTLLAFGVARIQPRLAAELHAIKDTDDVYPFPPPPVLRIATLGYVEATTDILWGKLLVENGMHWSEHRQFPYLEHYLDAIVALDPTFRPFYEYVDSLLCYRPTNGHETDSEKARTYEVDAKEARAYLERGTRELPNDSEIWMKYGQFVAFMGPSYLTSDAEKRSWRRDGALAMNHAVDLGADVDLGVASSAMLESRLGERDAAVHFLERAYALTDDEGERTQITARLRLMHASEASDRTRATMDAIESGWRTSYPFLDRGTYMLIAPSTNPVRCVGPASSLEDGCARDWDRALSR